MVARVGAPVLVVAPNGQMRLKKSNPRCPPDASIASRSAALIATTALIPLLSYAMNQPSLEVSMVWCVGVEPVQLCTPGLFVQCLTFACPHQTVVQRLDNVAGGALVGL